MDYDIGNLKQHYDKMSIEEKAVRLAAFHIIMEGRKAEPEELSQKTHLSMDMVKTIIVNLLSAGAITTDKSMSVTGSHGLSVIQTPHSLHINGRSLFAWCAADAIGIPAAMELDAEIVSSCAFCGDQLTIEMDKGSIKCCSKPDIRLWVVEADLGKPISGCT